MTASDHLPNIDDFDLTNLPAEFYANPYPFYQALRENAPVKRLANDSYLLTRYSDVQFVYKHPELFSSDKKREFKPKYGDSSLFDHHTTSLVFNDPPLHTRVRRLITGALHPKALAAMEPELVNCVDGLLDALSAQSSADLIEDFAMLIPIEIIGNMLAIPHNERGPLREWSLAILGALEPHVTETAFKQGNDAVDGFLLYLEELVARRRATPGDPEQDVLTRLIQGEDGDALSHKELLHNCIFILNAGHETTTNLIGNGLHALLENTQQKQQLLDDPGLINSAVEEFLRFESSNQLGNRITTVDVEIDGISIPINTPINLCIGAANRDPLQFPNPDQLDLTRKPNRHLAFGSGIHQCVGLNLARMEGRIAIGHFLKRFPQFQSAEAPTRGGRARFRGFLHLPVNLNPN